MMPIDRDRLREHATRIATTPRPTGSRELETAQRYVTDCLEAAGWGVRRDPFTIGTDSGEDLPGINLVAEHNLHPLAGGPRFCLGAHLDSRPESPGADDNASAVAALLEIARLLPGCWPERPSLELELVVFDLEECGMLGGAHRARQHRSAGTDLRGMVSLEMLGYCSQVPGSQSLPRQLVGLYPDVGNFIAIIGNQNSTRLIEDFRTGMSRVAGLPVESLQVPSNGDYLQATRLSDHSPFWDAGYAALMITDTSFLRNPHYHQPTDTAETLDFEFLERVTAGCLQAVRQILSSPL